MTNLGVCHEFIEVLRHCGNPVRAVKMLTSFVSGQAGTDSAHFLLIDGESLQELASCGRKACSGIMAQARECLSTAEDLLAEDVLFVLLEVNGMPVGVLVLEGSRPTLFELPSEQVEGGGITQVQHDEHDQDNQQYNA